MKQVGRFVSDVFRNQFRIDGSRENYMVPCPFHGDRGDKRRLYIAMNGLWICYRCERKGGFRSLVYKMSREDASIEPSKYLVGLPETFSRAETAQSVRVRPTDWFYPKGTVEAWAEQKASLVEGPRRAGLSYLESRGVNASRAEFYDVRVGVTGRFAGRVLFPVIDPITKCPVGWVGRTYRDDIPKVLTTASSDGRNVKDVPFNLDKASGSFEEVVLVEGIFDAVRHGANFLALLGNGLTRLQVSSIVEAEFRRITVMLDSNATREAKKVVRALRMHVPEIRLAQLPCDVNDPGDASPEVISQTLASATRM